MILVVETRGNCYYDRGKMYKRCVVANGAGPEAVDKYPNSAGNNNREYYIAALGGSIFKYNLIVNR